MEVPDWLRGIFLILTLLSFEPQIARIYHRRDSTGISLYYVLFNLIIATELFTISFFHLVNNRCEGSDSFAHDPPNLGDLFNLAHFTAVWIAWIIILLLTIIYSPTTRDTSNIMLIYVSFLTISLIPLFLDALFADTADPYHKWVLGFFSAIHMMFINPGVFFLCFLAMGAQAREIIRHRHEDSALSLLGLAVQAVLFAVLSVTWSGRLVFQWDKIPDGNFLNWRVFVFWFQAVGFVVYDYAVFAIGQGVLLALALRHLDVALTGGSLWRVIFLETDGEGYEDGVVGEEEERRPLLG
ncbi:Putative protein of unknown function [Podospora comata]|uniref:Chitin synthase export chaperone n=1 Tax=Podospora comata TaxID=48703 RepID=A0ABY6SIS5_PODCO|nr:Putative protein of unknown function [Podospora comata]